MGPKHFWHFWRPLHIEFEYTRAEFSIWRGRQRCQQYSGYNSYIFGSDVGDFSYSNIFVLRAIFCCGCHVRLKSGLRELKKSKVKSRMELHSFLYFHLVLKLSTVSFVSTRSWVILDSDLKTTSFLILFRHSLDAKRNPNSKNFRHNGTKISKPLITIKND